MAQQHLKFAIFGNEYQAKKSASIEKILLYLEKKEAEAQQNAGASRSSSRKKPENRSNEDNPA